MRLQITLGELFYQSAQRVAKRTFIIMVPSNETCAYGELKGSNRLVHGYLSIFQQNSLEI